MGLERKDILMISNKEEAFQAIAMKTEWSNHRKAAERSSWKKKHEPESVKKCPKRGRRYKKNDTTTNTPTIPAEVPEPQPQPQPQKKVLPTPIVDEDEPDLCQNCQKSSDGYDFPCKHPICYECFILLFSGNEGHMTCCMCQTEYDFQDNLVDEND